MGTLKATGAEPKGLIQKSPPPAGFFPGGGYPQGGYPQQPGYPPGFQAPPGSGYPPPYGGAPPGGFPAPPAFHLPPPSDMSNAENGYGNADSSGFSDKTIRRGFISKVYGILVCQTGITVAVVALFTFHDGIKLYVEEHPGICWITFIIALATLIALACCGDLRRKVPMNFVCLGIFTLAMSLTSGCAASFNQKEEVFYAALITFVVTISLTMFAFQTKIDFTVIGGILFVALISLITFGFFCTVFPGKTMILVHASLGALLFSVYIVYDTQMMMGGDHKYSISPEEYVFAALNLYLDILNVFLSILNILGGSRN